MANDNIDEYGLVGRSYTFPDGNRIKVLQIKMRQDVEQEATPYITFLTYSGPGIPKKEVLKVKDFLGHFGHLFGIKPPPSQPYR